ncbi:hypothetical protein H5410_049003 [Solanum commersonii]|uniref:Uncharacterized protein n=1 Tax=Solanum commersonii TaxID=4109 RepID=A0A9J5XJV3_SOLCO|nr:hypothetical protein H5410_049003 [Solanum commersonii]
MSILLQVYMLIYWNDVTLLQHYEEQVGGANEQNADQDWGINEQGVGANDHDRGANEQDGSASEQNVVQDEDANE